MPKAIRFSEHGGPEVLRFEDVEPGKPAAAEVQIRHSAIGVNFIDVYDRIAGSIPASCRAAWAVRRRVSSRPWGKKVRGFRVGVSASPMCTAQARRLQ